MSDIIQIVMREDTNFSDPTLIQLDNVSRSYGYGEAESFALKDFSLEVRRGEFIMIMGPSGCGKTTLLNVIGLLDKPTSGSYYLNGKSVASLSGRKKSALRSRQIGYIFQNFNLISTLPVIENVALPLIYSGVGKTRRLVTASEMLKTFHLEEREYFYPHQLSGGQQQRVCIARSLVNHPEIILADEPTGNLDSRSSHIVMEELRNIHSEGNTIIMVTHNPQLTTYATRVIHMLDGQIDADIKTVSDDDLPQITGIAEPTAEPETSSIEIEPASEQSTPEDAPEENIPAPEPAYTNIEPETITPAPLGEIADEPIRSQISGSRAFPIVGSEYIDKSVRAASKPSIEDLTLPSSPKRATRRPATRKASSSTRTVSKTTKSTRAKAHKKGSKR